MPNVSEKRIFKIIGTLYDIAQQSSHEPWIEVYKDMADLFRSGPGGISAYDKRSGTFNVFEGTMAKDHIDEYFRQFQYISPIRPLIAALKEGERLNREMHIPDEEFRRLPIYKDFYKRVGIFHFEYRMFLDHEDTRAGLSFTRPDGQPNFSENEILAMTFLMPHLARSFRLHFNLLDVYRQNRVMTEAFDHIPQGVVVVDRSRKLIFANARGTGLLERSDGIKTDGKGIVNSTIHNRRFERLIADIFDGRSFEADKYGGVASLERGDGKRPLELLISPFSRKDFLGVDPEPLAIIFVTDPDSRSESVTEMLTNIYGLTPKEARLAELLATGKSFAEACEEMAIAVNTGRTHLKRIFSKTDTSRQSALIKLILSGLAKVRPGE